MPDLRQRKVLLGILMVALMALASIPVAWAMPNHRDRLQTVPTRTPTAGPPTNTSAPPPTQAPPTATLTPTPTATPFEAAVTLTPTATPEASVTSTPTMMPTKQEPTTSIDTPSPSPTATEEPRPTDTATPTHEATIHPSDTETPVAAGGLVLSPSVSGTSRVVPQSAEDVRGTRGLSWLLWGGAVLLGAGLVLLFLFPRSEQ